MIKRDMTALKELVEGKGKKDPMAEVNDKALALLDKALGLSIKESQKAFNLAHQAAGLIAQYPEWDNNLEGQKIWKAAVALKDALIATNSASSIFLRSSWD